MKQTLAIFLLLAAVLPLRAARVTVTRTAYQGWPDAYRLSNRTVDVVVVPGIGRIMAFGLTGHPGTSPLFNNPPELGKRPVRLPGVYPADWANYGGDKVWPSPQSDWPQHQPRAWPPDPAFDQGPFAVTRLPNGVRLTGPLSPYYQIRVIREITLPSHGATVRIRDTFVKSPKAAGQRDGFLVGIWSVSQVRGDATVYLPLDKHGRFPGVGLTSLGDKPEMPPNWRVVGNTVAVTRLSGKNTKLGVDNSAGWMACDFGGNLLFTEHFTRPPHVLYPDKGCNAEVFTMGDDKTPYIEMEVLGQMSHLRAGQRLTRTLSWHLQHLTRRPHTAAQIRRLVMKAMTPRR